MQEDLGRFIFLSETQEKKTKDPPQALSNNIFLRHRAFYIPDNNSPILWYTFGVRGERIDACL